MQMHDEKKKRQIKQRATSEVNAAYQSSPKGHFCTAGQYL